MPRKPTQGLTEREVEILSVLWETGDATVEDIRQRLTDIPSASTVRTLLSIMSDRGLVTDDGSEYGKRYRAAIARRDAQRSALNRLVDRLFSGSAEAVLLRLIDDGEVDLKQLNRLQDRLRRKGRNRKENGS